MIDAAEIDSLKAANLGADELNQYFTKISYEEFRIVLDAVLGTGGIKLNLVLALARKLHEHAHFSAGLSDRDRTVFIAEADEIMDFAFSMADEEVRPRISAAWDSSKDYCARFGFSSGVIYEVLAPHTVFSPSR